MKGECRDPIPDRFFCSGLGFPDYVSNPLQEIPDIWWTGFKVFINILCCRFFLVSVHQIVSV